MSHNETRIIGESNPNKKKETPMTTESIYHELTNAVNIPGFLTTKMESYPDRIRIYLERRTHVARCSRCGRFCGNFYDSKERVLRDYDWGETPVYLVVQRVRVKCPTCKIRVEKLTFADLRSPFTTRFQDYLVERASVMTRSDIAFFYDLSEDTIGRWEWMALQMFQPTRNKLRGLKQLRVDEIAKRKGHNYVTVISDAETNRVVWVGDGRKKDDLLPFFRMLGVRGCLAIEAVCMDMSRSYIPAFENGCKNARIVFDRFHIVKHLNDALNKLRKSEKLKLTDEEKSLWRHSQRALGKNKENLTPKQRECLEWLLTKSPAIATAYYLKSQFSNIWKVRTLRGAKSSLTRWLQRAKKISHEGFEDFCKMVERHRRGILNYHYYPLTNGPQEGLNNKFNVIRRRAYGFARVDRYSLKILQASAKK